MSSAPEPGSVVVLEAHLLCKSYSAGRTRQLGHRHVDAVKDVSFSVESGGSLAIVGESGSGKTTVARMLVGQERPTSGKITLLGQAYGPQRLTLRARRARARTIQLVFQDPHRSLDPRQQVGRGLREVLRLHSAASAAELDDQVGELLAQVGLTPDVARRLPVQLSGGQCQRVALARALAPKPQVLVLDEAVSALDVSVQAQILNLLSDIRESVGITMIFISHNLAVVHQICDDVLVMQRGVVVESGSVEKILSDPDDEYTKQLLASVPGPSWVTRPFGRTQPSGVSGADLAEKI